MAHVEEGCFACDLAAGRIPLPGGRIYRTGRWLVEHCVGPLGRGSLIVKPERHITAVADLTPEEAAELGPLLVLASRVARGLTNAEQVYNCLWSHKDGVPNHIHYVVQPVTKEQMEQFGRNGYGPGLQEAMYADGTVPTDDEITETADRARRLFLGLSPERCRRSGAGEPAPGSGVGENAFLLSRKIPGKQ